jgi:hypothetical protein
VEVDAPPFMPQIPALLAASFALLLTSCATPVSHSKQLAQLVATNTPCRVRLQPAWEGTALPTVLTGSFASISYFDRSEGFLHFDWFTCRDKPSPLNIGPRTISNAIGGNVMALFTFRPSLPGEAEFTVIATLADLQSLLGPPQNFVDVWGEINGDEHTAEHWAFFTVSCDGPVETLRISCTATREPNDREYHVDSLKVVRGFAWPKE